MKRLATLVVGLALPLVIAVGTAAAGGDASRGAVYTLTNSPTGNAVAVFDRAADGSLTAAGTYATGGLGTGGGLGSGHSIVLSENGRYVIAVNAGSNSVSALAVTPIGLRLLGSAPSGGTFPNSVAVEGKLVYVLNSGSQTISGYTLGKDGLTPIAGSTLSLGSGAAGASQIQFDPKGEVLVVTERGSNTIETFTVDKEGIASGPATFASNGGSPFGFDFDRQGHLLVSDANLGPGESGASSYDVGRDGNVTANGGAVQAHQSAACWLAAGKGYAFTANAGSGSISSFAVGSDGSLSLVGTTSIGAGSHPLDESTTNDGYLYVLADGQHRIVGYRIAEDGLLVQVASAAGLPAGAAGIATR